MKVYKDSYKYIKPLLIVKLVVVVVAVLVFKGYLYFGDKTLTADEAQDKESQVELKSIVNLPKLDSKKLTKQEAEAYFVIIDKKKQELIGLEKNIKERQDILTDMQKNLDEKLKKIENEKNIFIDLVDKQIDLSEERKKELANYYKKMTPKKAAPIFASMDIDYVVSLFHLLPEKQVTSILAEMPIDVSKKISEYYGRVDLLKEYSALNDLKTAISKEFSECK